MPKGEFKNHLLRIGISEGDTIRCIERLPGGTIVIQKNRQEIAVGFDLARQITVIQEER
jgi:ferrous iron transport protein A